MKSVFLKYGMAYNGTFIIALLLMACNSGDHKTNMLINNTQKNKVSYFFQDTTIRKYLFEGGYEGVILEIYREKNEMFPYKTSHARIKASLTPDSTFIVNYLFFKSTPAPPDTVSYFFKRDSVENSYYLKKELIEKDKYVETRVGLLFEGKQIIPLKNNNYELFKFKSKDSSGIEYYLWLPDIGIIKLESELYDKSFILSFTSDDFRTKIIKDLLKRTSL